MTTPKPDVAVFIDFENIYVSVREKFDATPNFESIMDRCGDYGRVVIARAYADWYRYPRITSALFANGIEPMYVPTYYYDKDVGRQGRPIKNSVDMHLCIDAMRTLYSRTNIQRFILVTGDRDFIPLVNSIRQEGKEVIIIGIGGAASSHLAQSADEFLFYEQIVEIRPMTPPAQVETRAERDKRAERQVEKEEPAEKPVEQTPDANGDAYEVLVEAVRLARKRGYVCSFGSLKVLMKELLPNFKESRYRDSSGKPFAKFTDFVREAERQGRVQIFTSGTVNEVFLPGEDPYKLSQFAADLPSVEAERELEAELTAESTMPLEPPTQAETRSRRNGRDRRRDRRGRQPEQQTEYESAATDLPPLEESAEAERPAPTFGEREWRFFLRAMVGFQEAAPFADIFNELRELRNREERQLTNHELKELLKQGINQGMLQRSNRGAKAHYRLHENYRESALAAVSAAEETPQIEELLPDLDEELEPQPEVMSEHQREPGQLEQQLDPVETEQQVEAAQVEQEVSPEALPEPVEAAVDVETEPAAEAELAAEPLPESAEIAAEQPAAEVAPAQPETLPAAEEPQPAAQAEEAAVESVAEPTAEVVTEPEAAAVAPELGEDAAREPEPQPAEAAQAVDPAQAQAPAPVEAPQPTRTRRRRKATKKESEQETAAQPSTRSTRSTRAAEGAAQEAEVQQEPKETKPRRRRRKTEQPAAQGETATAPPASEQPEAGQAKPAETSQAKPRRRRRKAEERPQQDAQPQPE